MARDGRGALHRAWPALLWALVGAGGAEAAGVVGNGTPGSCTEAALNTALAGGGAVTFNCGASPVVIPITSQKVIAVATTVDGGSADRIILDAGGATRHFTTNQTVALTVRNLTLRNGRCPIPDPGQPSPGYGGSIRSGISSPLTVTDSRFLNNVCDATGNDVGGGAIRQRVGALTIQRTLFQGNRAGNAGAISSSASPVLIEDSTFVSNTTNAFVGGFSGVGGGFYNDGSGGGLVLIRRTLFQGNSAAFRAGALQSFFYAGDQGLRLEDCTFIANTSGTGPGALLHQDGPLTVLRSSFAGNTSSGDAGGAFLYLSTPTTISDTTFSDNQSSGRGGGLWLVNSAPTQITNSTFSGNRALGGSGFGGGIAADGSNGVTLTHVTLAGNQAGTVGGGIGSSTSSLTLRATILSGNTTPSAQRSCTGTFGNGGFNVQFPAANPPGDPACTSGALMGDPQLAPLANNGGPTQTHALGGASPARNLVTSACPPPSTDQRGVARPQGGACDSGSFESSTVVGISGVSLTEGNAGSTSAAFTVSLASAASQTVTVGFSTASGTATAGSDYTSTAGTVTFPPGTTSRTASVPVLGDTLDENDETFVVNLSNAVNATIGTGQATGTILDDDAPPAVSAGDCLAVEGGVCAFPVSLGAPSGKTVSVSYATAAGSAQSGADFTAASGAVTFPPGGTAATAFVSTIDDAIDEVDETFALNLSNPGNATIGDGQGSGTIDDNDGPALAVTDVSVAEGNAGGTSATFTVSLSAPSVQPVTVDFGTSDGTATAGADYAAASGSLSFTAGATSRTATVTVSGDTANEPNERFYLNLSNAVDGRLGDPSGIGTIVDDDGGLIPLRELAHGMSQWDTLAGGADLFLITVPPRASYEVVVDGASGDVGAGNGPLLQRVGNDLGTVVQSSVAAGAGPARSLRWQNATSSPQAHYVRISSAECTSCGGDDVYRVRVYETSGSLPRFNCAGGQISVVVVQNRAESSRGGTLHFWNASGALLGSSAFALNARGSSAVAACSVGGVAGQSGTVTLRHDGRLGDVEAKAVALDAATGFSFDTPMAPRRR